MDHPRTAPLVMRPASECVKVWFVLTVILFVSLLVSGLVVSAFEPQLWGGPERQQVLVQNADGEIGELVSW